MTNQPDLSIIIVHYKTPELLMNCVDSIVKSAKQFRIEIIVVDNDSQDETEQLIFDKFSDVVWINTGYNAGFARANNIGIRAAKAPYVLLLNSDTIVQDTTIDNCLNRYKVLEEQTKIGFLACQLIDFDGNLQFNSRFKTNYLEKIWNAHPYVILLRRILRKPYDSQKDFNELFKLHHEEHYSPWLGGTFLLIRKNIIEQKTMQLDEDFFMYGEDIEWCLRLGDLGFKHFFYPEVHILHAEGGSFPIKETKRMQIQLSEWLLLLKRHGKFFARLISRFQLHGMNVEIRLLKKDMSNPEVSRRNAVLNMYYKYRTLIFSSKFKKTSGSDEYLKYEM